MSTLAISQSISASTLRSAPTLLKQTSLKKTSTLRDLSVQIKPLSLEKTLLKDASHSYFFNQIHPQAKKLTPSPKPLGIRSKIVETEIQKNPNIKLEYQPEIWNDPKVQLSTNCYAYALNLTHNPLTRKNFPVLTLQPGNLAGYRDLYSECINLRDFKLFCKQDAEACGAKFEEAGPGSKCPDGGWKVALCSDNSRDDYHWYRQDSDGTWSHKLGKEKISNLDASGNTITDPEKANRTHGNLNYDNFAGYFYVTPFNKNEK